VNQANALRILETIKDTDRVLDIGGWMKPFPRADYVMDIMPYESRGLLGSVHDGRERFTRETWIVRDFCDRQPYPFPDKFFDFAICSHVLEDIRDPVYVCSELTRVARAGYIETPSRVVEQMMGIESDDYPGYCHHRWLIEAEGNRLTFTMKNARIAANWKLHLPLRAKKRLRTEDTITSLFWNGSFDFSEQILIHVGEIDADLERVVRKAGAYSPLRYAAWAQARRVRESAKGVLGK
jgi:hypothetical protein